ncbi:unnamed protein product (macronuclear) [Paramecium tetraurelia]|uniref:Transmembrane protein n=1 Tax=Paramecium tetraurelia TaxID=5888 RepID=A0DBY7_PARTE|nr:uncharacterized protein GSPATT00015431001 [Paramecium tetraurelia]CAK80554.1 unnamed protein product [Paramecium tetraurelia]|eukprot:XP_001447951.1 hypothetical protein (macronuclear) [Paramecium tetraurelia strain d4-2]
MNKEANMFYKFSNDFQELSSDKWNLTFVDFISSTIVAPDHFTILQSQQLLLPGGMSLCSLLQNKLTLDYSIYCKDVMPQKYRENNFSKLKEFTFLIAYQEGLKCNDYVFLNHLLYILCQIEDQIQLISFDLEGNRYQNSYNISQVQQQCKINFKLFQNQYLLVYFCQCLNWELIIFDQQLQFIRRFTDQEKYLEVQFNSNKELQDLFVCQQRLYLIFDREYISLLVLSVMASDFQIESKAYNLKIQRLQVLQLQSCRLENQGINLSDASTIFKDKQLENLKIIQKLGLYITCLVFNDQLILMLTNEITQTIRFEIKFLSYIPTITQYFWVVDNQNKVNIFEINLFQNYFTYQSKANYVGFYTIKQMKIELIRCFAISQQIDKQDYFKNQIDKLKYQNYLVQIDDNFDGIQIEKQSFFLNRNLHFHFTFPSLFQQKIELKKTNRLCCINRQQLNLVSKFFAFKIKSQNYFMFNKNGHLVIYHCNSQRFMHFNIQIDLNSIRTYYLIQELQFILVQENEGRIITFIYQGKAQNSIQYQMYLFKEQIRTSFTYKNQLIVQDQNSLFYFNTQLNIFQKQSPFNHNYFINSEIFRDAIQIFNFFDIFILQYGSYFIVQVELLVTLKIYLNIVILGGYSRRSQPPQVILIGMDQNKSRIDKYLITNRNYYLLQTYYFEDYFPIQPLNYQINEQNFIIATRQQSNNQFHLMLFIINQINSFECHEIISTPYQYFYAISNILYYYDVNQELIEYDIKYLSFDYDVQPLKEMFYNLQFQIDITDVQSPRDGNIYSEKFNLLALNLQEELSLVNQSDATITLNNNQAILYPNQFLQGEFMSFDLSNTSSFTLQSPFKLVQTKTCISLDNNFCVLELLPFIKVLDLNTNTENQYLIPYRVTENIKFHGWQDMVVIVEFSDLKITIQYYKKDTLKVLLINESYQGSNLVQQILIIQTSTFTFFYFLDEEIRLLETTTGIQNLSINSIFYQIDSDKICKILFESDKIHISCFQIKQGVTSSVSNYTIPTQDIYNAISLSDKLIEFSYECKIQVLNLTSIGQNELDLKITVNYRKLFFIYQQILQFYVQITLKDQEYQIKLNNLIKLSKHNANCKSLLLQNNLLYVCSNLQIFLYKLESGFQLLDSYAIQNLERQTISILNNTHIAEFNQINTEVSIYEIDYWRLIKNENINVEEEQTVTFIASNLVTQLEFKVNVVKQSNHENIKINISFVIIVCNVVFIQMFILIKKQKRV